MNSQLNSAEKHGLEIYSLEFSAEKLKNVYELATMVNKQFFELLNCAWLYADLAFQLKTLTVLRAWEINLEKHGSNSNLIYYLIYLISNLGLPKITNMASNLYITEKHDVTI